MRALRPGVSLVVLLAGSLLVGLSMGRWLAPLAAWIGPVLILRYSRDHKVGRGYAMVLAALVVAFGLGFWGVFVVGEWLWRQDLATHHGYPIVFGAAAVIIFITGLVRFAGIVRRHPVPPDTATV
jgi:MFS family permease